MQGGECPECAERAREKLSPSGSDSRPLLTFTIATASGVVASVHLMLTQHDYFTWVLTTGPIITTALASLLSWMRSLRLDKKNDSKQGRR